VLWAHDADQLPVGRDGGVHLSLDGSALIGLCRFVHRDLSVFGDQVARFVAAGFLSATSVGFEPIEWETAQRETEGFFVPTDFKRQRLREYSIVPVPANADCLADRSVFSLDDVTAFCDAADRAGTPLAIRQVVSRLRADLLGSKTVVDFGEKASVEKEIKLEPEVEVEPAAVDVAICESCGRPHTDESAAYAAEQIASAGLPEGDTAPVEAAAPESGVTVAASAEAIARMALSIRDQFLAAS
jgi:HK97 family phage prohead protease